MDLRFKEALTTPFGHLAGETWTLEQVAWVLGEHVRGQDSVIRLGGDEFVVILLDCGEDIVCRKIEELRAALVPVAEADFGYAYTDQFSPSVEMLRELLDHADRLDVPGKTPRPLRWRRKRDVTMMTMQQGPRRSGALPDVLIPQW